MRAYGDNGDLAGDGDLHNLLHHPLHRHGHLPARAFSPEKVRRIRMATDDFTVSLFHFANHWLPTKKKSPRPPPGWGTVRGAGEKLGNWPDPGPHSSGGGEKFGHKQSPASGT